MIRFENVCKHFGHTKILDNLCMEIGTGEFTVLIGPSGCGKTTILKTINRLVEPDNGTVYIDGKDISRVDKVALRRSIGYVIQQIGLFPAMTVEENIAVVPKLLKYPKETCHKIVRDLLDLVNMPYEEYARKYPSEMSGGQQQRVGVLRALAASPPIVLMDEPFGALDPMTRSALQDEILKLQKKLKKTIVFVTHDMDEALLLADKIIFMNNGQILQAASPEEMLETPADDLIRNFLGKRTKENESLPQKAADFMRTAVYTINKGKGIREAADMMARRNVDTLLVKRNDDTYDGVITIGAITQSEHKHGSLEPLINTETPVSYVDEDAQECFAKLFANGSNSYVVVLNRDQTIAGIVTKGTAAKSLADAVWR